ncbi:hypothetical protein MO867_04155 [Microbulbifer sp. OS29]|uniref:Lipoprotein n=1 Tax=Microbulbifer okhotskensis TaxID=2926617 RepID=A0A9X2EPW7_9GAMM|nr:Rcs stress response system protein RcsF [Microbulbifer okhotskensis]MCO1333528.1 hypothetical protein [Microbulbifer okhotskensis]
MNKFKTIGLVLLLTGCGGINIKTNTGSYISHKVKTTLVKEYTLLEAHQSGASLLGSVSSTSCQASAKDERPNQESLNKSLKLKVYNLGGNGIVLEGCSVQVSAGCLKFLECHGLAYQIPDRNQHHDASNKPPTNVTAF